MTRYLTLAEFLWLAEQVTGVAASTLAKAARIDLAVSALLDEFTHTYNHTRPHRSLPHQATPATAYTARPKAASGDRNADTYDRIRRDRVDQAGKITLRHQGRLYSIGIGRTHTRTRVILLAHDLDIPHHPRRHRRTPPRTGPRPHQALPADPARPAARRQRLNPHTAGSAVRDVLRHHSVPPAGSRTRPATARTADSGGPCPGAMSSGATLPQ